MSRLSDVIQFIDHDHNKNLIIEPEMRYEKLKERLFDVMNTYKPASVVKAGLGNGRLLYDLAGNYDSYFTVVEPSSAIIKAFIAQYGDDSIMDKIRFINGEFKSFPVDYYAADLLICIDYLDFIESAQAIDEFRRALEFETIFFLGMVVLNNDDLDGIYDDFMREIFPLHNDFYIEEDLKTFMDLNEFQFIKGSLENYNRELEPLIEHLGVLYPMKGKNPMDIVHERSSDFERLYQLKENTLSVPYFMGVFMKKKYEKPAGSLV